MLVVFEVHAEEVMWQTIIEGPTSDNGSYEGRPKKYGNWL